jgi:hypothetical protein
LLHRHGDGSIRRQPNFIAFDFGHKAPLNEVMVPLMSAFAAVVLRQLYSATLELIDRTDVNAVSADNFHMFFYNHSSVLCEYDNARVGNTFTLKKRRVA